MQLKDFLKSINDTKENLIDADSNCERLYPPFIVNRCLSYFTDTILYSNEMNMNHQIDHKMQYDYYINSVRKRKRFSRWLKNESTDDLDLIKFHYKYSDIKAKEALSILGSEGVQKIRDMYGKSVKTPKT
jgi:hypothetical protein